MKKLTINIALVSLCFLCMLGCQVNVGPIYAPESLDQKSMDGKIERMFSTVPLREEFFLTFDKDQFVMTWKTPETDSEAVMDKGVYTYDKVGATNSTIYLTFLSGAHAGLKFRMVLDFTALSQGKFQITELDASQGKLEGVFSLR